MSKQDHEHGTVTSYVVGFILSLIFTLIPYHMVVNQTFRGTALLLAIMGFALLQAIIQITFFLHLGRGPKPRWNLFFFVATVSLIMVVVGGSIVIINNLHYNMQPSDQTKKIIDDEGIYQINGQKTGACYGQHTNHVIIIKNDQISPLHTTAGKCDTLTFTNVDKAIKDIAFGEHPQHEVYAGQSELTIKKGQSKTISLSQAGTYNFHDHLHEQTAGTFTVSP